MIKDIEHVPVYREPEHSINQGSLVLLNNGNLFLGCNQERGTIHNDTGQSCFIKSTDNGRSWDVSTQKVVYPYTDYEGNWDCAFSQTAEGTILMHTRVCSFISPTALNSTIPQEVGDYHYDDPSRTHGVVGGKNFKQNLLMRQTGYSLLWSNDNGDTWEGPIPVNTAPVARENSGGCSVGGSGGGHIVELNDGSLLMPLEGSITLDQTAYSRGGTGELCRVFTLRSDDGGSNWEYWSTVAFDPANAMYMSEPSMTRLQSGKLVCMWRVQIRPGFRFDNMWFATSEDDGASWSRPARTPLWGYPPDLIQLQDGRVLAVYGYRRDEFGVRGCVSEDGESWSKDNEFSISTGGNADPNVVNQYWHTGYPSVVQCEDGTVVVAYHEYSKGELPLQEMWVTRFKMG